MKTFNRISETFSYLKEKNKSAMIAFLTAGDPNFKISLEIIKGMPARGVDIIEIGMPFSDPMADGETIQKSYRRSLIAGNNMDKTLKLISSFRKKNKTTPVVLMGYFNPIYYVGVKSFVSKAINAGVDGLLIVDFPPEADSEINKNDIKKKINFIRLATPTTNKNRLKKIVASTSGFLYYVSITGITGNEIRNLDFIRNKYIELKKSIKIPFVVGFGINTPKKAMQVAEYSDGVVIGSALVREIEKCEKNHKDVASKVLNLVSKYVKAIKKARIN